MKTCYFAQLFLLDEEQLNEVLKEQTKEKDSQLEIDFEKDNKESEFDVKLNKMTKKELIECIKDINIELDKCNENRKCEIVLKENLRKQLCEKDNEINKLIIERKDIATQFKEFATEANKKADKLIIERNELLNKLSKANCYIDYLKATIENIKLTMRKTFNIVIHV